MEPNKKKQKKLIGIFFLITLLVLILFFGGLGYLVYKDILLVYVVAGIVLLGMGPLFYMFWKDYGE